MNTLEKEFVPYEQALALKELGFDEPCLALYSIREHDDIEIGDFYFGPSYATNATEGISILAPTFSQAFRWFREKYDLHVQIRKENYFYKNIHNSYFHFDISQGQQYDITGQQDLYSNIMDECSQDIPGNYLNNEKLNSLIFEKGFAFKTYEEAELACLQKLIQIIKDEHN